MALEPILKKIDAHLSSGSELMAATRDTMAATRDTMEATRDTMEATRDTMEATRDTMEATRDTMAATSEALNDVRLELRLSREIHLRQMEQQDDLQHFIRDQITRMDQLGRPQTLALERVEQALRGLALEIRELGGSSA